MVVNKLSGAFGEENLDMSLGVLYEFIEVNDNWDTWQDTAGFRRWAFHHSRRNVCGNLLPPLISSSADEIRVPCISDSIHTDADNRMI